MEKELFFTGYCRQLDASRMVEVMVEDGKATEVDCCYPDCPHAPACDIAQQIKKIEA